MNKELLEPIMRAHGDKNKDLAAAIGMSVPRSRFIKSLSFRRGNHCPCFFFGFQIRPI